MELIGRRGDLVLFASDGTGVLIDESTKSIMSVAKIEALTASVDYVSDSETVSNTVRDLAEAALTTLDISVFSNNDRMHTIPKAVQAEAKRALEWRAKVGRGGTPVGLNTARTLARGGQIGIRKIRHIAKYFPRHEVDKKGKGYRPGEQGYPSNGRIAWALWGGDAAKRWASAIVEREDKKNASASIVASYGYERPDRIMLSDFRKADSEFLIRTFSDGSGIDRLYKVSGNGRLSVWDDGSWDELSFLENSIESFDSFLDDEAIVASADRVPVDSESAIIIAALLDSDPFSPKSVFQIDSAESDLVSAAWDEIDWPSVDAVIAAGAPADGKYTSEERSENTKAQIRDAKGKFAEMGGRVIINGNPNDRGTIKDIDPQKKTATVELDNGSTVEVPVSTTEKEEEARVIPGVTTPPPAPVDTSGILAEPKIKENRFKARLEKFLPVVGPDELKELLADFPTLVENSREQARSEALKASGEPEDEYTEPKQSDVTPIYMAIVADDDPQAVMDVIALAPASAKSNSPSVFKREPGKWVKSEEILADLNSPTPPPVVKLDQESLESVMSQVDSAVVASMIAAGGADRNRGNAEKLRRYWLTGKGAAKIRWNTGGDWKRCVKYLSKYMGPRAKGYCALRHKEATGMWTGDKPHRQMYGRVASAVPTYSDDYIITEDTFIKYCWDRAAVSDAKNRILVAGGAVVGDPAINDGMHGSKFFIPLIIPEGVESGDGRIFDEGVITMRDLPLPLLWQIKSGEGHSGSVVVGKITSMERVKGGIGNAHGVFDSGEFGKEAERLVRGGFIRGVSADLDKFEASEEEVEAGNEEEDSSGQSRIKISKARVMAATLVPKPAFQECTIQIVEDEDQQEDEVVPDGVYVDGVDEADASALVACGIVAGIIPTTPPESWFDNPKLKKATPLTVDDEGRVFGHIAAWHVDHIGMAFGTKPPRSRSNYSYFHTGVVRTESGKDVPVGQLTLAGGHASLEMSAKQAVRHYDDTASAIADVHAGEDAYGIWVAGALRPGTTPEQIRALRASAPSGDWRPIKGHLELVAVCQVNVPGFPIARARVASGQVMALVAAGANVLAHMKGDPIADLNARISRLESEPLVAAAEAARAKVMTVKAEELANRVHAMRDEIQSEADFANISEETRQELAKKGQALPDGSYPIRNVSDLKNAIKAFGRSKPSERTKVRKHIVKRARALGKAGLIPENWPEAPKKAEASVDEIPVEGLAAAGDGPCWEGYEMVGMKMVDGKEVPNCVPIDASGEASPKAEALHGEGLSDEISLSLRERISAAKAAVSELSTDNSETLSEFASNDPDADITEDLTPEEIQALKMEKIQRKRDLKLKGKAVGKYVPGKTQPRDAAGKFRKVLARLKSDLGDAGLDRALEKVEEVENLDYAGDYDRAAKSAAELLGIIDRLDAKALNPESLENVRTSSAELGKVIANLPFAFGATAQKIRFSDVPPALRDLMEDMITRVEAKIGKKDADIATADLRDFISGNEVYNQSEISAQMAKLLRLLT